MMMRNMRGDTIVQVEIVDLATAAVPCAQLLDWTIDTHHIAVNGNEM